MEISKEIIVLIVSLKLNGVLVGSEEGVMSVGHVSHVASHEEGVLNGGLVGHRVEEVSLEVKNHKLFHEPVTHHELLGSTRDVTVVVLDSHTGVSSDLDSESDVLV